MEQKGATTSILPPEVWVHTLGFLPNSSLASAACVCKDWSVWVQNARHYKAHDLVQRILTFHKETFDSSALVDCAHYQELDRSVKAIEKVNGVKSLRAWSEVFWQFVTTARYPIDHSGKLSSQFARGVGGIDFIVLAGGSQADGLIKRIVEDRLVPINEYRLLWATVYANNGELLCWLIKDARFSTKGTEVDRKGYGHPDAWFKESPTMAQAWQSLSPSSFRPASSPPLSQQLVPHQPPASSQPLGPAGSANPKSADKLKLLALAAILAVLGSFDLKGKFHWKRAILLSGLELAAYFGVRTLWSRTS